MFRYLRLSFTRIGIVIKETKEYKANLYSSALADISIFLSLIVFALGYKQISTLFLLNWNLIDFISLYFVVNVMLKIFFILRIRNFRGFLLSGTFSTFLIRPFSSYFLTQLNSMKGMNVILFLFYFPIMLIYLISQGYSNIVQGLLFSLLGIIYAIILFNLLQSLSFFLKESSFLIRTYQIIDKRLLEFTPAPFFNTNLEKILVLFPVSIYGYFVIEIFRNNFLILNYLNLILVSFLIIIILQIYFWKKGLERYEAFG